MADKALHEMTDEELSAERDHWDQKIQNATGWGAALAAHDSFRANCDAEIAWRKQQAQPVPGVYSPEQIPSLNPLTEDQRHLRSCYLSGQISPAAWLDHLESDPALKSHFGKATVTLRNTLTPIPMTSHAPLTDPDCPPSVRDQINGGVTLEAWTGDNQFEDGTITTVEGSAERGWSITKLDGWSFWVPKESPVAPAIGMPIRMYGKGIGYMVRGLLLDGQCVFYRTEAEQVEHAANEAYGKDAADLLSRWDEGRSVWSVAMGGFGPGYEQALQIAAFEVLRHLISGGSIEQADVVTPSLDYLGLSGAQWGAARSLARAFHADGPRKVHDDCKPERHIQVSKDFPSPAQAEREQLEARVKELEAALKPFSDVAGELFAKNYNDPDIVMTVKAKTEKGSRVVMSLAFKPFRIARNTLAALQEPRP